MQVPVCSCVLTMSPWISSWHWSLAWFMPSLAKFLEILPFLHFYCLGPQWKQSIAVATGQLDACSQLLPTAHWKSRASVSIHQVHITELLSLMCHMGVTLRAVAEVLQVQRYEVSYAMADESAAQIHGRGWPDWVHLLSNTSDRSPGVTECVSSSGQWYGSYPALGRESGQVEASVLVVCKV